MVKLFVGNISPTTDPKELKKLFEKYGAVSECDVIRNYAFIHMKNEDEARKACEKLNNHMLEGKTIHIEFSTSKLRKAPGMDEVCFRCGEMSHKTTSCPMHDSSDPKFGSKRSSTGDRDAYPPPKRVECYFTPSREMASSGLAYNMFSNKNSATVGRPVTDPDPLLPRPADRQLDPFYDEYLIARERYYFYRSRLTSGGGAGGTLAPPPMGAPPPASHVVATYAPPTMPPTFVAPTPVQPTFVAPVQTAARPVMEYYAATAAPQSTGQVVGRSSPNAPRLCPEYVGYGLGQGMKGEGRSSSQARFVRSYPDVYYQRTANGYEAVTMPRATTYPVVSAAGQSNVYLRRNENGTYETFTVAPAAPTYVVQ